MERRKYRMEVRKGFELMFVAEIERTTPSTRLTLTNEMLDQQENEFAGDLFKIELAINTHSDCRCHILEIPKK